MTRYNPNTIKKAAQCAGGGGMTEHNSGPWSMHAFGVIPSDGPTKYRIVDSEGVTVGFTYGYSEQDWLNALVMAAAPGLLTACEDVKELLLQMTIEEPADFITEHIKTIENAIVKARGGGPRKTVWGD